MSGNHKENGDFYSATTSMASSINYSWPHCLPVFSNHGDDTGWHTADRCLRQAGRPRPTGYVGCVMITFNQGVGTTTFQVTTVTVIMMQCSSVCITAPSLVPAGEIPDAESIVSSIILDGDT